MSGQKYKRTNFDDDENTSTAGTPPGVTYDPAIAFKVTWMFVHTVRFKRMRKQRFLLILVGHRFTFDFAQCKRTIDF